MAIYHLSVKSGAPGKAAAHAGYILREGQYAEREDLVVAESGNLPRWSEHDAKVFWDAADLYERANGRPYRELEIALPRELNEAQQVELVRDFADNTLGQSHAYTWAIHSPKAADGGEQPHVHLMFSERKFDGIERDPDQYFRRWNSVNPELGGAGKDRYFSSQRFVWDVRSEWAHTANQHLERAGFDVRIDARSFRDQGLDLEPQRKKGISYHADSRGVLSDITRENREIAARNGDRISADPSLAVAALTANQSLFSKQDLQQFVFRHSDSQAQFESVLHRVLQSPHLVAMEKEGRAGELFTSKELFDTERSLVQLAERLSGAKGPTAHIDDRFEMELHRDLGGDQVNAYRLLTSEARLVTVNGAAGTGKSFVLGVVREAYERSGFRVLGAALQGKTADDLQRDAGIQSTTLHRLLDQLDRGQTSLDPQTVVVIDEAGLVGSRQFEQLLGHVEKSGSAVRVVGDTYQLHAVSAGDAFRAVSEQSLAAGTNAAMSGIRRQHQSWQREASVALSQHRIGEGLEAYQAAGFVTKYANQDAARSGLIAQWAADRETHWPETQLLVTHSNRERQALNEEIRALRKADGELGSGTLIQTATGRIELAVGDRVLFTRNDETLEVKNGSLGELVNFDGRNLSVRLDDGTQLNVDPRTYDHFDHGYALTIHKAQGVTVDRAYVLATPSLNAQLTYVALTRHRESVQVAYGADQFSGPEGLKERLSRVGQKSFTAHHALREMDRTSLSGKYETIADRREREGQERAARIAEKPSSQSKYWARLEKMSASELREEIVVIGHHPALGKPHHHPDMEKVHVNLSALQVKRSEVLRNQNSVEDGMKEYREDHPNRVALHELRAIQSSELVRFEKELAKLSKQLASMDKPIQAAQQQYDTQLSRVQAEIAEQRPHYEQIQRHAQRLLDRKLVEESRVQVLREVAQYRHQEEAGYRDGDAHWKSLPQNIREGIDRYRRADPVMKSELEQEAKDIPQIQRSSMIQSKGIERER